MRFFDPENGYFKSSILALNQLDGGYKYPQCLKPIHFCATNGLELVMQRLPADTATNVESGIDDGRRPHHMAAENGQEEEIVKLILGGTVDIEIRTLDGRTPLQYAMESGNEAIGKLLMSARASLTAKFAHGETPLSFAVGNGWLSMVRFLLEHGADPDQRLFDGRGCLHVAAEASCDNDMLKEFFSAGANHKMEDENLWTSLHIASYYGHVKAAVRLTEDIYFYLHRNNFLDAAASRGAVGAH
jgi:ankyrin repeat protein